MAEVKATTGLKEKGLEISGRNHELGYQKNLNAIEKAYNKYVAKAPDWETDLYNAVFKFAAGKGHTALKGIRETANTGEDVAQQVAITVFEEIGNFVGNSKDFYSWVNRIAYLRTNTSRKEAKRDEKRFVDVFVPNEFEPDVMEDNPEIYAQQPGYAYPKPTPEWLNENQRVFVGLLKDGHSFKAIASILGMSIDQVHNFSEYLRDCAKENNKNASAGAGTSKRSQSEAVRKFIS